MANQVAQTTARWRRGGRRGALLLLEEDVVLLPEPCVGQVARVGLRLAGEEGVLGDVDRDVLWWRDDEGWACGSVDTGEQKITVFIFIYFFFLKTEGKCVSIVNCDKCRFIA